MSKRLFTKEQIDILLKNKYVVKCSPKSIGYSHDFKVWAINQWDSGLPASDIFKQAEFDLKIIGEDVPKQCLGRWRTIYKIKGVQGLRSDGRGKTKGLNCGRPKIKNISDAEKIRRLEATVAYLKAEKNFLVKLRSGKAE